ncbi:MAG: Ubiquinone biosynthesis O-methyltransferase [Phycisphaerae bacterium]|nr:Ubiquinone biosynthesis O-methyltransferase [Phycisphaerae bacterium]
MTPRFRGLGSGRPCRTLHTPRNSVDNPPAAKRGQTRVLLTLTTTRSPATDLGWLLHKRPAKAQAFELTFGRAHVFYPEATEGRCTAALLLEVDPIRLVRRRGGPAGEGFSLQQYVNDRPYVASSFMSVALAQVYGSALGGRCKERPELVDEVLPLEARLAVLPCRGGEGFLRRLFEPLGYEVLAEGHALDTKFTDWGDSNAFTVTLRGEQRLCDLLAHLYVLIPVLDNDKHYWVGDDEVEKLLRKGEGWLAAHPERDAIARRYLKHRRNLAREALARLVEEDQPDPDAEQAEQEFEEEALEAQVAIEAGDGAPEAGAMKIPATGIAAAQVGAMVADVTEVGAAGAGVARAGADGVGAARNVVSDAFADIAAEPETDAAPQRAATLNTQRLATVLAALRACEAASVVDVGCGEGNLLRVLLDDKRFERILGMDVSLRSLKLASERLRLDRLPPMKRRRIELIHGSLMYRDARLRIDAATPFDAAACVEVIEHLDAPRLAAFERVLFEFARPRTVIVTTPNREYNVKWETLPAGRFRHRDHRFEWTREEFQAWTGGVAERFGYSVRFLPVGPEDAGVGAPTQMGVFESNV